MPKKPYVDQAEYMACGSCADLCPGQPYAYVAPGKSNGRQKIFIFYWRHESGR